MSCIPSVIFIIFWMFKSERKKRKEKKKKAIILSSSFWKSYKDFANDKLKVWALYFCFIPCKSTPLCARAHTHTHTHTHTYTLAFTYLHTNTLTYKHTNACTHMYAHTYMHTQTCTHTCTHTHPQQKNTEKLRNKHHRTFWCLTGSLFPWLPSTDCPATVVDASCLHQRCECNRHALAHA